MSEETFGIVRGLTTLFAMLGFIGVCVWAYSRRHQRRFDDAARLPLEDEK